MIAASLPRPAARVKKPADRAGRWLSASDDPGSELKQGGETPGFPRGERQGPALARDLAVEALNRVGRVDDPAQVGG